jgi:hypothetical protein
MRFLLEKQHGNREEKKGATHFLGATPTFTSNTWG